MRANAAAMSCFPPHKQLCYQLLKYSRGDTPASISPHYLTRNITHLLIYLEDVCFDYFFFLFPRCRLMCQYSPQRVKQYKPPLRKKKKESDFFYCSRACSFSPHFFKARKSFPLRRPPPLHMPAGHTISSCFELF